MNPKSFFLPAVLSAVLAVLCILFLDAISFPWIDELSLTDTPARVACYGQWFSNVDLYQYHPLHGFLLAGWLKIFGVSHQAAVSLDVVLALAASLVLLRLLDRRLGVQECLERVAFVLLFWGGGVLAWTITNGRVDMLVLLLTTLLVDEMIWGEGKGHRLRLAAWSFLQFFSAIYAAPPVVVLAILLVLLPREGTLRKQRLLDGIVVAIGYCAALFGIGLFYLRHHILFRWLHGYFRFNGTVSGDVPSFPERIQDAYGLDLQALVLFLAAFLLLLGSGWLKGRGRWAGVLMVGAIPLLMTLAGRYTLYYAWMFHVPVIVLFVLAMSSVGRKWAQWAALAVGVAVLALHIGTNLPGWREEQVRLQRDRAFLSVHAATIDAHPVLLFMDPKCYYDLFAYEKTLYCRDKMQDAQDPAEHFRAALNEKVPEGKLREVLLQFFLAHENLTPRDLPASALIILTSEEDYEKVAAYFAQREIPLDTLFEKDAFRLLTY